jgi:hypothetical protein
MSLSSVSIDMQYSIMDHLSFRDAMSLHSTCNLFRRIFFEYFHLSLSEMTPFDPVRNRFYAIDSSILSSQRIISSTESTNFSDLCMRDVKFLLRNFIPRGGAGINECIALSRVMQSLSNAQLMSIATRAIQHDDDDLFLQIAQSPMLETEAATDNTPEKSDHCELLHAIVRNLDIDILERFVTLPAFAQIPISDHVRNRDGHDVMVEEHLAHCFMHISMECEDEDIDLALEFSAILFDSPRFNEMDNIQKGTILMNYVEDRKWAFVERFFPYFARTMTLQDINHSFATYFFLAEYDEVRFQLFRRLLLIISRQNPQFLAQ